MTIVAREMLDLISHNVEQTQRLGARLGSLLTAGDVIALQGELGSGKTNFVKGIARGLAIRGTVHSPTFILANEYRGGRLPLFHVDAYRVGDAAEALGFGFDDYLNDAGVTVIEWAERIRDALPTEHLWIEFRYISETKRAILMQARGSHYQQLVDELKQQAFK
jgi:tRNA threonylcarbamoyladenosine biosynthesis protein TsaE